MEVIYNLAKLTLVQIEDQLPNQAFNTVSPKPIERNESPTPNNPPWGVWTAVGVWVSSVLFILIIPSIFLLPYLATIRPPITDSDLLIEFAKSDPTAILLQILAVIPAHIFTLLLAWLVVTKWRTFSFRTTLGWKTGGITFWHYVLILVAFFGVAAAVGHFYPEQENDLLRILRSSRAAVYMVAFMATFTAPIVEEVVYRGVLFSAFQRTFGVPAAFLIVTFLFAVVHVPQYYPSYSTIFLLALLSITLTLLRVWSKNLLPCIVLHMLFNGVQSILLMIQPWLERTETQEQTVSIFHFLK